MTKTVQQIKQELFNVIIPALVKQGQASYDEGIEQCVYRKEGGNKCAVGHIIPEAMYDPDMENNSAWRVFNQYPEFRKNIMGELFEDAEAVSNIGSWLNEFQYELHDRHRHSTQFTKHMLTSAEAFASWHNLEWNAEWSEQHGN